MFMSNEQIGLYIKLLCAQHQHGAMIEEKAFNNLVKDDELLRSKFIKCEGGFFNERLMEEMSLRNKKSNNISYAMKDVWEKRKIELHEKSIESYKNPKRNLQKKDSKLIGIENANEDENVNIINKEDEQKQKFILEPLEIIKRLKENEYQIMEYAMKTFKFSESQYCEICEIFVGEKTTGENELDKEYSEVIKQFKSWIKYHSEKLTKLLTQKDGTERKIGRHSITDMQRFLNGG